MSEGLNLNSPRIKIREHEREIALRTLSHSTIRECRRFALSLVPEFRPIARRYARLAQDEAFSVEIKSDHSPVTQADREIEELVRTAISTSFPSHGIIGEEGDDHLPTADFQWTVDPIDGTDHLATGVPTFGVMIGLSYLGHPLLGLLDHPLLDITTIGAHTLGVQSNGTPCSLRNPPPSPLRSREILILSSRPTFERTGRGQLFDLLMQQWPNTRVFYDCSGHTYTVRGSAGALVELNVHLWDLLPTEALIREAGGSFISLDDVFPPPPPNVGGRPLVSAVFGHRTAVERVLHIMQSTTL